MAYKISEHFTLEELYSSTTAKKYNIDNIPSASIQKNIMALVVEILEPLRQAYGKPIIITSGYRCPKLNIKINGSKNSAHMSGFAVDTKSEDMKEYQEFVLDWIKNKNFDQCIIEHPKNGVASWIHISLKNSKGEQRKQIITIN